MKITKILVAISFLFAVVTSANAGELTVTGNMTTTYQNEVDGTTGNPFGMDRELKFSGSTELDNGMTVSVMQDTNDSLTFGNSQMSFGNILGFATIYVGSDSDPVDGIDDVTPTAFEEANGAGSGSYVDVNGVAGTTGIGFKATVPYGIGALNAKFYPKADGAKNADKTASGDTSGSIGNGSSVSLKTDLGVIGVEGLTLTTGYAEIDVSTAIATANAEDVTAALNYAMGPIKIGYQKAVVNIGTTAANTLSLGKSSNGVNDETFYKNDMLGVAYAVNDSLSVSLNRMTSNRHLNSTGDNPEQTTNAISLGYTMGGMTIGVQNARTENSGFTRDKDDDTRTLSVAVAF